MDRVINILVVEPGKEPRRATVADTLKTLQEIVGGPIEVGCYLPQRVMLICNGEGKSAGLPPNRPNPNDPQDHIYGAFLLCGYEGEHFASLSDQQRETFQDYFALSNSPVQGGKEEKPYRKPQVRRWERPL